MEEKITMLIDCVNSLSAQIQKLIVQETVGEDETLVMYLKNKNMYDFVDRDTKQCFKEYIIFKDNVNPTLPNITQNAFNRTIKKVFSELSVGTTTRHGKSMQYFKRK